MTQDVSIVDFYRTNHCSGDCRPSKIDDEVYIHKREIVDEERVDGVYVRKGYKVVEYLKHDISSGYRTVPLTKKAKKILEEVKKLSPDSEYLFTQSNGERMTSRSFNYWLEKYCRNAGVTFKSSHCIRRTFASRLYAEGMPLEEISVYMGHEDTDTTKGYIYNYNEIEKNRAYMDKALLRFEYVKGCCTHPAHMIFRHKKTGKLDFTSFPALFH